MHICTATLYGFISNIEMKEIQTKEGDKIEVINLTLGSDQSRNPRQEDKVYRRVEIWGSEAKKFSWLGVGMEILLTVEMKQTSFVNEEGHKIKFENFKCLDGTLRVTNKVKKTVKEKKEKVTDYKG